MVELKLVSDVSFTPEREKEMLFSSYPMGTESYYLYVSNTDNGNHIGNFDTLEEATEAHEREKRKAIRRVAEEYKQVIPDKVYKALLAW